MKYDFMANKEIINFQKENTPEILGTVLGRGPIVD